MLLTVLNLLKFIQIATWISCVEEKGSLIGETASCGAVKKQELLKKQEKTYYLSCIQSTGLFYKIVNNIIFFFPNVKVNNRISRTLWRRYGRDDVHL